MLIFNQTFTVLYKGTNEHISNKKNKSGLPFVRRAQAKLPSPFKFCRYLRHDPEPLKNRHNL